MLRSWSRSLCAETGADLATGSTQLPESAYMTLRYEDLALDLGAALSKTFDFVGIRFV